MMTISSHWVLIPDAYNSLTMLATKFLKTCTVANKLISDMSVTSCQPFIVFYTAVTNNDFQLQQIGNSIKMNLNGRSENRKYSAEYCLNWRKLVKNDLIIT